MINLIPPQGHSALHHEYILRVGALYGFLLGGVLVAGTVLMIPTYVLTGSQLEAVRSDNSENAEATQSFSRASDEIKTANAVMSQLKVNEESVAYSAIIEEIVRSAPSGITFNTFQIRPAEKESTDLTVQGLASTRNALATFKSALEVSPLFEKAEIPISDLARDTNLPFVVTITLKKSITTP